MPCTTRVVHEMAFTAKPISAERAERLGMINNVVPKDELESFTMALANDIAANAPLSIAVMKEQLRILAAAKPMSPQGYERIQGLRRVVYDSHGLHRRYSGVQGETQSGVSRRVNPAAASSV